MSEFENDPSAAGEEDETDETPRNDVVVKIGLVGDAQVILIVFLCFGSFVFKSKNVFINLRMMHISFKTLYTYWFNRSVRLR